MTKTLKKPTLKKTKKAKSPRPEVEHKMAPDIAPGLVSISMLPSDLTTLTNLMGICAKIFEEQALLAAQQNDEQRYAILSARHRLTSMFANRFVEFANLGEPESRDMH